MTPPNQDNPTPSSPTSANSPQVSAPATPSSPNSGENTKAVVSLILGILSLVCCGFFSGIPAIIIGRSEIRAIDEGRSDESNRAFSKVGMILGIIGTIISTLRILIYVLLFIFFAIIFGTQSTTPNTF